MDAVLFDGIGNCTRGVDCLAIVGEHLGTGVLVGCGLGIGQYAVGTNLGLLISYDIYRSPMVSLRVMILQIA